MNDKANMLLLEMQKAAGCIYLSDMRTCSFDKQSKKLILGIPDDQYTVEEWNEAVSYVTNVNCSYKTIGEAKLGIEKLK